MRALFVIVSVVLLIAGIGFAQVKPVKQPAVAGAWTGTWGPFLPGKDGEQLHVYTEAQKKMDCKVESLPGGEWQATFEGECGRPYKYTIKMPGRSAGEVVLFKGSADLGEKDGGVYDWIGRASDTGFVGFFTSRKYAGTFQLARPKD